MKAFIVVLAVLALGQAKVINTDERIYNGVDMNITDVPYVVGLRYDGSFACTGGIISEYYILTAAHCAIIDTDVNGKKIVGVGNSYESQLTYLEAEKSEYHELYQTTSGYDIAYIKLKNPLKFSDKIQSIPLGDVAPNLDDVLQYAGWGRDSDTTLPDRLQGAKLRVIDVTSRMFYVSSDIPNQHTGGGDSGSPAVKNGVLVGVHINRGGMRSGATTVAPHRDWIREKTGI